MQKLISQLIRFESDKNHPEEIRKCFDFIVNDLKKAGLRVKTFSKNGKPSLIAAIKLKKHYHFFLNGHIDVVPGNYKDAFKPRTINNRLYGRGVSDMKGLVTVMIQLIKELAKYHLKTDAALMINSDEEVGGFDGVKHLVDSLGYSCKCAIVPDSGQPDYHLELAEKGVLHVKLESKGKAAHGSRPWLGDNALEKLLRIYQYIQKNMPEVNKHDNWKPTVNLGVVGGGEATNIVPDSAFMQLDFRFPKKIQRQFLIHLIKQSVEKEKEVSWKILAEGLPLINNPNNKYFKRVKIIAQKHSKRLKIHKGHGASDGRFFSARGIPVIMFKPNCSQPHIANEWIDLKNLDIYYQILRDFILFF